VSAAPPCPPEPAQVHLPAAALPSLADGSSPADAVAAAAHAGVPILSATGVTVAFGSRTIIREVDLAIGAGERIALVGPNGAGKSTLLRALTGMVAPTSGTVALCGSPLAAIDRRVVARTLAVVPELQELPFGMPVVDVVALGRLPYEPPLTHLRPTDRLAVDGAIERVGIEHLRQRDVRVLSMGERQLVFIALALAQEAPILILDEPTVHLDIRHQVEVMQLLVDLNARGTTVVAVLHDLAFAAHFFPRVAMIADGAMVADGPAAETLADERIRSVFGVDPALVRLSASTPSSAG
jgi:iron complex transport system ATP-binding protein